MAVFDLSDVVLKRKPKQFPSLVTISLEDAKYLVDNPNLLGKKYLSLQDIKDLPVDHSQYSEDGISHRYFSSISDIHEGAIPFSYNGEVIGDQVTFNIGGLHCASDYLKLAKLNSLLQSVKTLLSLMSLEGHIHTNSFRVKKGKNWNMQYTFVFTSTQLSHKEVFGYGQAKGEGQGDGQDGSEDGNEGDGGEAPPM